MYRLRKFLPLVLLVVLLLIAAAPAEAQNGCVNSPENPTALLALLGFGGAATAALRNRLRR